MLITNCPELCNTVQSDKLMVKIWLHVLKISGIHTVMHGNAGEIAQQNNGHPAHVECEGTRLFYI